MKKIFLLWVPLAAMWLMMGIEMPLINAVIARMPEATANLAAFGVTLSLALIIESPIIQMLTAGTALVDHKKNYERLMEFMHLLAIVLTAIHLLLALTPLYSLLLKHVIGVPEEIIPLSRKAFLWMFPWTAAVGYRRLWQGVLIRFGKTSIIPLTMIARLVATSLVLASGFFFPFLTSGEVGGIALTFGVTTGAVTSYIFLRPIVKEMKDDPADKKISWPHLIKFYYPLALTNFVNFIVRPVLTFGIARAAFPLESLAIWPVVTSFMFLFRSMALAYQEVAVSLLKKEDDARNLKTFAYLLGGSLTVIFSSIAFSPLSGIWYHYAAGLSSDLLAFTFIPTLIVTLTPFTSTLVSFYRGILIYRERTKEIAKAIFVNSATLLALILIVPLFVNVEGGIIAAIAFTSSIFMEQFYLRYQSTLKS